jgi:hypothetical protein
MATLTGTAAGAVMAAGGVIAGNDGTYAALSDSTATTVSITVRARHTAPSQPPPASLVATARQRVPAPAGSTPTHAARGGSSKAAGPESKRSAATHSPRMNPLPALPGPSTPALPLPTINGIR